MSKVLLKTHDHIGKRMAGPAIRYFEFAKHLSREHQVTLAAPNKVELKTEDFEIISCFNNESILEKILQKTEVVIAQHYSPRLWGIIRKLKKPCVVDLYCPWFIENLEYFSFEKERRRKQVLSLDIKHTRAQILGGDFFLCANEEQRNLWIGMLAAAGRLSPRIYDQDKSLSNLIEIVPFGLPDEEPRHTKKSLKGVYPNIKETDKVILWNGGLWNWLDPLTPIRAMAEISREREDIKLVFMGIIRPYTSGIKNKTCQEAINLSKAFGIYNRTVLFNEGWVDYAERQNFLLEADIGMITHLNILETKYAFRTRLLDCIWAKLPIITSVGGSMSNLVEVEMLGITCDFKDVDGIKRAIYKMLEDQEFYQSCKLNLMRIAPIFKWENVIKPLNDFCKSPKLAADKTAYSDQIIKTTALTDIQDNNPELSVIIPTKNRREILKKCLEALWRQSTPKEKFEIIVVDDGSTDQTEEMLKSFQNLGGPNITYVKQVPYKMGPAAANNLGVSHARGTYVLFINNDILAKEDLVAEHLKLHKKHKNIIVQGKARNSISLETPTLRPYGYTGYTDINFGYFTTWNVSVRKDTLVDVGLFDEDFQNLGWEDVELGFRLRKCGIKQKFNPRAIGYHYAPPFKLTQEELENIKLKALGIGQNAVLYYLKHPCLETRIASQIWWFSRLIDRIIILIAEILGKKRILIWLETLEKKKKHKILAFFVGLASFHWYMLGVKQAWQGHLKQIQ